MNLSKFHTFLISLFFIFLTATVISHPQASFEASKTGLSMWWEVVFPSLLPFFILSELLIGFGIVRFVGLLLEPFMRPIFRVPGVGGFVLAMGMASGNPAGAKLTARLRQEKQISRVEAERLVSFTNSSNPLFIFAAVAVGFFHNASLGILLASAHYLGNIAVGLTMRSYGRKEEAAYTGKKTIVLPSLKEAFLALHKARLSEKRPLGKILGDAVTSSVQTLLMVGGFIILFSVFSRLLSIVQVMDVLSVFTNALLSLFHLPVSLDIPLISGMFEITLGSKLVSEADAALLPKAMIVSFILGFSGLSVQAQVAGILSVTDIRFKPFFTARILQGIYAALFVLLLWKPLYLALDEPYQSVFLPFRDQNAATAAVSGRNTLIEIGPTVTLAALAVYALIYCYRLSARIKKG
ncbi:sporulation integral membrane protein YlbJ [Bacillus amyloliquefaciens]|jgi:sporulation integral membrane protein YlbJ|uniref:sporulation integral membrane protein YlbJ n=1 Tax=Bacillus amyloliquefaciens TaxID=1390 RepID=UPI000B9D308F|nr:sporulation integral membrane protein YlbJ [Bacillus amyloliquefaciens]MDR4376897.1 sporulation integral membrane protein YlbJ [Bacillus amyloliquefaciens]MEC1838739.1 sporulation integral membrane protein YlbJ [Bacillus amyloliquefaciens]MEC2021767.1 sporulation integral membrane protein YlbJ [Bacillus amyloliquefaciens]MEC2051013.1 sporulation integral membrane protein YlbJ [Bacillus amyloliquefaciens]OXL22100.1 sporulation integral membrane protein YlbJ [Bacillus amyloliquefaciens]